MQQFDLELSEIKYNYGNLHVSICRLETPTLQYSGTICVSFDYHMYGNAMGSLSVYKSSRLNESPIFSKTRDQGNQWQRAEAEVVINNEKVKSLVTICTF
jgi:hypothetical protein